jgi:hypothetical protein
MSLYYGSKYVFDRFDGADYAGYTDVLGVELRHDVSKMFDVGVNAAVQHAWKADVMAYSFGPSIGIAPFTNAWLSVGYNVVGFEDSDRRRREVHAPRSLCGHALQVRPVDAQRFPAGLGATRLTVRIVALLSMTLLVGLYLLGVGPAFAAQCARPSADGDNLNLTGVVNTYWSGTVSQAVGSASIALGQATGANSAIAAGDMLLVIQMQDADFFKEDSNRYGDAVSGDPGSGYTRSTSPACTSSFARPTPSRIAAGP